jgi:hypothetical protein
MAKRKREGKTGTVGEKIFVVVGAVLSAENSSPLKAIERIMSGLWGARKQIMLS